MPPGLGAERRELALRPTVLCLVAFLACCAAWPSHACADCSIAVQGGVSFGIYNVFSTAPLDSTGTISYRCGNKDHGIRITLTRGNSSTYRPRSLVSGPELLGYNLFTDAARTLVWGDETEGTSIYSIHNPPNLAWTDLTIFGRIPAGQDVAAGGYSDTVTVEINF